ncbi:amidase family protein [Rhodovulum sp. DZ06]|uniref:amidase family protein n=1 Tax=Rhodovulum sp. DZ06 TaxID=3425126 RepID=UPI003D353E30
MHPMPEQALPSLARKAGGADGDDRWGAFLPGPRAERAPTAEGPLSGLRFAVQDLVDLQDARTGAGNPGWLDTSRTAARDAAVVAALRAAGAAVAGKTVTDELGFSLEGVNPHYGAPVNPRDEGALCGGSASGAAAATAAGLVEFALGVDTGGSVRIPAALCGLWAFRPTHGRLPLDGILPFAPSMDAPAWMAADPRVLRAVGDVLLPADAPVDGPGADAGADSGAVFGADAGADTGAGATPRGPGTGITDIRLAEDAAALCDADCAADLQARCGGWITGAPVAAFPGTWKDHLRLYAYAQAQDLCDGLGKEVERRGPALGEASAQRLAAAMAVERSVAEAWNAFRRAATRWLLLMTPPGRALLLPTAPMARLPRDVQRPQLEAFYSGALPLSAIAGAAGAPQVQMPLAAGGVSLIGRPGQDRALLDAAMRLAGVDAG